MPRGPGRHSERNFRAAEQHYNAAEWPTDAERGNVSLCRHQILNWSYGPNRSEDLKPTGSLGPASQKQLLLLLLFYFFYFFKINYNYYYYCYYYYYYYLMSHSTHNRSFQRRVLTNQRRTNLVNSKRPKRQQSSVRVNEQNLAIKDHVRAVLKRLRYVLLQMLYLWQSH